jgi:hypothetical protein
VIRMRRLAVVFAILAILSTVEQILFEQMMLTRTADGIIQAPRRICRSSIRLSDWRAFLVGPLRLFQRATSRGTGPWLGLSN